MLPCIKVIQVDHCCVFATKCFSFPILTDCVKQQFQMAASSKNYIDWLIKIYFFNYITPNANAAFRVKIKSLKKIIMLQSVKQKFTLSCHQRILKKKAYQCSTVLKYFCINGAWLIHPVATVMIFIRLLATSSSPVSISSSTTAMKSSTRWPLPW